MDMELIGKVSRHARRGGQILFGRSHTGILKIKVRHGPFRLFTTRYHTDPITYEWIKRELVT